MARVIIGGQAPAQTTINNGTGSYDYQVDIVAFTPNPEVTFAGGGTYNISVDAALFASYTVVATGGTTVNINETGSFLTTSNLVIKGASTIELGEKYSALTSTNASFSGTGGTLTIPSGKLAFMDSPPVINGFKTGDFINFGTYTNGEKAVYAANGKDTGTLTLEDANGKSVGSLTLIGHYTQADFGLTDNNGLAEIVGCFLRGTRIMTTNGEVAVEHLSSGDEVVTASGALKEVKAVRLRRFSGAVALASVNVRPVCIAAGAFAENIPSRTLFVSPDHSMLLNGVLVPAQLLVNGETVTQPVRRSSIDYFHVEVEPHDVILAEGAAAETYLDIGASHFAAPGLVLHPASEPRNWEDACAPLVLAGPVLQQIRADLLARAAVVAATEAMFAAVA